MLQPSENFTAKEIKFLQNGAKEWIRKVNDMILKAANDGQDSVRITVNTSDSEYYKAPSALWEHFKNRGFELSGHYETSSEQEIRISW